MSTLNLTFLVSTLGRSGPTNQLYNLVRRLDTRRFSISIITISPEPVDSRWRDFENLGFKIDSIKLNRFMSILFGKRRLVRFLKDNNTDLLHSHGIRADFLNYSVHFLPHRVATQRNDPRSDYPMYYGRFIGLAMAKVHLYILARIPRVVTCSEALTTSNKSLGIVTTCVQNGIDNKNKYIPTKEEKLAIRVKLNLPTESKLIVWVSPFIPRKMPETVVSAFSKIVDTQLVHLCLLGDGPSLEFCKSIAKNKHNISFCGNVNNVDDYLRAADLFVSSSLSEGLPNSVLEALAWGVPVILSDIPAHREILNISYNAGVTFPAGDHRQLFDRLSQFRPSLEASQCAKEIIDTRLNSFVMASNYQKVYESIMHQN